MAQEFEVDQATLDRLGENGMAVLGESLWPVDCQSCGGPFPPQGRASLAVDVAEPLVFAGLYHRRCRPPGWNDTGYLMTPSSMPAATLTHKSRLSTFWLGEQPERWTMMITNPGMEMILLRPPDAGEAWQVDMRLYASAGLRNDGVLTEPGPDAFAEISGREVCITLSATAVAGAYSTTYDAETLQLVEQHGGLIWGISHALHPGEADSNDLRAAMDTGRLYTGWVQLRR